MVLALTSCSKSDSPAPIQDEVQVSLTLSVGEVSGDGTRAPSDGEYNPGDAWENYIDVFKPGNVRVVLLNPDKSYLGELTDFIITPVYTGDVSKRYTLTASTKLDLSSGKFKVMVLANWPSYPEGDLTLDKVWAQEFTYQPDMPNQEHPIPLYGIKDIALDNIEYDIPVSLGRIHLLRAVAKIEVVITGASGEESDDVWEFDKLELSHYNGKGFSAPANVEKESDYVQGSWDKDYVAELSIPGNPERKDVLKFRRASDNHYVVYVPEYDNQGSNTAKIAVKIAGSVFPGKEIIIVDSKGRPLDFHRNVWYRITINKNLEASVDVIPYAACPLKPVFGLTIGNEIDSDADPTKPGYDPEQPDSDPEEKDEDEDATDNN